MKKVLRTFFVLLFIFVYILPLSAHAEGVKAIPIKILLVPGHDDDSPGAIYGNLREADMNMVLARKIFNLLKKDKRFDVHITREGPTYTKEFADYFISQKEEIKYFIETAKKDTNASVASGAFIEKENTPHNAAKLDVAFRLYALNKWANDNKMDVVVHIHFNDYNRKTKWERGDYRGFAIYVPEEQFPNSNESYNLADNLFLELEKKYATSNYVNELGGIIFDQKLIALGSNKTLLSNVRSVLVEYGYIYRFGNYKMRQKSYTQMSALTAKGIKKYFFPK